MTITQSGTGTGKNLLDDPPKTASDIAEELKDFIANNQELIRTARKEQKEHETEVKNKIKEHEAEVKNKVSSIKQWEKQIKVARLALDELEPKRKSKKSAKKSKKSVKSPAVGF
jgi:DNA-binding protein H-NS